MLRFLVVMVLLAGTAMAQEHERMREDRHGDNPCGRRNETADKERCVQKCMAKGIGGVTSQGQGLDPDTGINAEVYASYGHYVCPTDRELDEKILASLEKDAKSAVEKACGGRGNLLKVEQFSLTPRGNEVNVAARILCKAPVKPAS